MSRLSRLSLLAVLGGLLAAAPAAAADPNPWRESRTWNIAHQGGEDEFPSNTMYAFKQAMKVGADMLELDVGVTKDDQVIVMHDTTLDRTTNGTGTIASHTLAQIRRLDGAYWFSRRGEHYGHDKRRAAYRFRAIATGKRKPPKGYTRADFRVPTLRELLRAFPRTPINVEIKGRTKAEGVDEYLTNARVLASLLNGQPRRDVIVVSFKQPAVDLFHELAPQFPVAPGIDGAASFLLGGVSPGDGVVAFQLPITYVLNGTKLNVTTPENVARAHEAGYAWHNWFGDGDADTPPTWRNLIGWCVDGVMTARPRAFERTLQATPNPAACGG
ncbi:glycerophosphodiester phosphodiesterase family protein [Capillimicrobium parvum]|uniref:Glycerophosphodiester phosphodiesterase n=1 Tax=Capillimicrobium parvum TaxID=2884022 RepID=A0A9E6XXV4_9ACTN|nr:glycerophosphodiester phosphodiesterase family protein [Capillimicrobium parvum]UGS36371.1 Glycerophosphodiester phosphodiesterase [Capillimicrobium parvum]